MRVVLEHANGTNEALVFSAFGRTGAFQTITTCSKAHRGGSYLLVLIVSLKVIPLSLMSAKEPTCHCRCHPLSCRFSQELAQE